MYELESTKAARGAVYKAGAVGGIFGFILSVVVQFWPQICAVLHFCVATPK